MLKNRRILLGVAGGIAAYKAAEMARQLIHHQAEVQVAMTENACRFINPLTFRTLTQRPVALHLFADPDSPIPHIALAQWAEMILVLPATADLLARAAAGRADDLLSAILLDTTAPVLWAPAMNSRMWENPLTQENVQRLRRAGHQLVLPEKGKLACGEIGIGHLASLERILAAVKNILLPSQSLAGRKCLITAGPTREPWDAVRFFSNRSTGKMGYALATEAQRRGAEVILVSGPVALTPPLGVQVITVTTAQEMYQAAMAAFPKVDLVIAAAAVMDFRPAEISPNKIKKESAPLSLKLVVNPDILKEMGEKKEQQILVGFAAETQDLVSAGQAKRATKNLDLLIANYAAGEEDAFAAEEAKIILLDAQDRIQELPRQSKALLAKAILDQIETIFANR